MRNRNNQSLGIDLEDVKNDLSAEFPVWRSPTTDFNTYNLQARNYLDCIELCLRGGHL